MSKNNFTTEHQGRAASGTGSSCNLKIENKVARVKLNIFNFIFSCQETVRKIVKYSVCIEYEKSWKYIFHLLQDLQGIILEPSRQIAIKLCEAMTFRGTLCKNIARTKIYPASD